MTRPDATLDQLRLVIDWANAQHLHDAEQWLRERVEAAEERMGVVRDSEIVDALIGGESNPRVDAIVNEVAGTPVPDLMAALRASVEAAKKRRTASDTQARCEHGLTEWHEVWRDHDYWDNGHGQSEHAPYCKCQPRTCPGPAASEDGTR